MGVVPKFPEEMTAEWLTDALRENGHLSGSASVISLEIAEIGVGRGYVGLTFRLIPSYSGDAGAAPRSMVVKLPTFIEIQPELQMLLDLLYSTEISWYKDLRDDTPARVPVAYWSGVDTAAHRYCLVLEDMGSLRMTDQISSCSIEEARMIVGKLGKIHAHWWNNPTLTQTPWLMGPEMQGALLSMFVVQGWAPFWEMFGGNAAPVEFEQIGALIGAQLPALLVKGVASGSTLLHGDFRLENFMFGAPGADDELVVLDWQLAGRGSGPRDLAYFVSQNLPIEMRRAYEQELIGLYHDALSNGGVEEYSREQLYEEYRIGLLAAMLVPINGVRQLVDLQGQENAGLDADQRALFERAMASGELLVRTMTERNVSAILDNKAGELLGL
jgi:hypothetical protein